MPIKYTIAYNVTSNECIAGNGEIPERSDTSECRKEWNKGSVSLQYSYDKIMNYSKIKFRKLSFELWRKRQKITK